MNVDLIFMRLPDGYKLEIMKKPPNGKYHRARIMNRYGGCVYEIKSKNGGQMILDMGCQLQEGDCFDQKHYYGR